MNDKTQREALAKAWDEGQLASWKRGPSGCKCGAWSEGECACGLYGTGAVLSLAANPYRNAADTPASNSDAEIRNAALEEAAVIADRGLLLHTASIIRAAKGA